MSRSEQEFRAAAKEGNLAKVQDLSTKGIDIDAEDKRLGQTALIFAAQGGHNEVCTFLIQKGASVNHQDDDGLTALSMAIRGNHPSTVSLLIDAKADPNIQEKTRGDTPLIWAAYRGQVEIVQTLLQNGADPSVKGWKGKTAAEWAKEKGHDKIVEMLANAKPVVRVQKEVLPSPKLAAVEVKVEVKAEAKELKLADEVKKEEPAFKFEDVKIDRKKKLGRGGFGTVYEGTWHGNKIAVKVVTIEEEEQVEEIMNEAQLHSKLIDENVIRMYGYHYDKDEGVFYIVMEKLDDNLYRVLHAGKVKLEWKEVLNIARKVALAMKYLHGLKPMVVHRDLKSSNVLISNRGQVVKICDFGLAKSKLESKMHTKVGTNRWMAPEVMQGGEYTEKADLFSYGMFLWELITGALPFADIKDDTTVILEVINNNLRPKIPENCPKNYANLMTECWDRSPKQRPNFNVIVPRLDDMIANLENE